MQVPRPDRLGLHDPLKRLPGQILEHAVGEDACRVDDSAEGRHLGADVGNDCGQLGLDRDVRYPNDYVNSTLDPLLRGPSSFWRRCATTGHQHQMPGPLLDEPGGQLQPHAAGAPRDQVGCVRADPRDTVGSSVWRSKRTT